jgi:RimJ/RimL family protein N-acetyltransferase
MAPILTTDRLVLRPFRVGDAAAVQRHCGNWNIARMLARVPHPYTRAQAEAWIASHPAAGESGAEHVFCIEYGGEAIGSIGLRRIEDGVYDLGYWLGAPWWGRGLATEAARRIVRFAVDELCAARLTSGHFADNPASGRVLEKCGFRYTDSGMAVGAARGAAALHRNFELLSGKRAGQAATS